MFPSSFWVMAEVSILKPTDQLWPLTRGGSLKITALPSVTALPFRSHMLLKKQPRRTEHIHNIFLSPLPGFVRPANSLFLDCKWLQQSTMSWESEPPHQNYVYQLYLDADSSFLLDVDSSEWKMSQISGKLHLRLPEGSSHRHYYSTKISNSLKWKIWRWDLIMKMISNSFFNFLCCSCFLIMAGLAMISLLFTRDYNNPTVTKTFRYFTADKSVTFFI